MNPESSQERKLIFSIVAKKSSPAEFFLASQVQELGDNKIRVGQISPGCVDTEIYVGLKDDPAAPFKKEEFFKLFPSLKAEDVSFFPLTSSAYLGLQCLQC